MLDGKKNVCVSFDSLSILRYIGVDDIHGIYLLLHFCSECSQCCKLILLVIKLGQESQKSGILKRPFLSLFYSCRQLFAFEKHSGATLSFTSSYLLSLSRFHLGPMLGGGNIGYSDGG